MDHSRNRNNRSTWKVFLLLFLSIALLLFVGGRAYFVYESKQIRADRYKYLKAIGDLKIDQITGWIKERKADIRTFCENPTIKENVARLIENPEDPKARNFFLIHMNSLVKNYGYQNVMLVNPEGKVILALSDHIGVFVEPVINTIHLSRKTGNPEHSGFYRNSATNKIQLDLLQTISDEKGKEIAAVLFREDPESFLYPLIRSWPTPSKTSETLIIKQDGDDVLFLNELRQQKDCALKLRIPMSQETLPAVQAVKGKTGVFEGKDYRGEMVLSYLKAVEGTPWFMVAKVDSAELFAAVRRHAWVTGMMVFCMIFLAGAVIGFSYNSRQKKLYSSLFQAERDLNLAHEEFKTTLYSIGDAVITTDTQGLIKQMNPVAEDLTGYLESEAIGRPLNDVFRIINENTHKAVENPVERVMREGLVVHLANHTLLISKDGRRIPIADSGAPIKSKSGDLLGVVLVFQDQSIERAAQKKVAKSEERLRLALAAAKQGLYDLDLVSGRAVVNDQYAIMLGYEPTTFEETNQKWLQRIHPDDRRKVIDAFRNHAEQKSKEFKVEFRLRNVRGLWVWVLNLGKITEWSRDGRPLRMLGTHSDITDQINSQRELQEQNELLQVIFDNIPVLLIFLDTEGKIRWLDKAVESTLGWNEQEVRGTEFWKEIYPDSGYLEKFLEFSQNAKGHWREFKSMDRSGKLLDITWTTVPLSDGGMVAIGLDLTQRRIVEQEKDLLEEQLRQSQKMEAVGRLAGGIAHDFNNILTAIQGFGELLYDGLPIANPMRDDVKQILNAARTASHLTHQLLAFSRKQIIDPKVINLNDVIESSEKMLKRLIGEDVDLVFKPQKNIWSVKFDVGQIDQILVNLAVNSRDAMKKGGKITIETQNVNVESMLSSHLRTMPSGQYVMLAFSDTGKGISVADQKNIFEPFFTTKGMGTGLGLSTVYGIVKQNRGYINVYSEPEKGTTFKIYIPMVADIATRKIVDERPEELRGSETILLVEDQDVVRRLAERVLTSHGYNVLTAVDGGDALTVMESFADEIDLLFTDVVMPNMSGRELYDRVVKIQPDLKVLYMSGYTENAIAHHGVLDEGTQFLQKPFRPKDLLRKIRVVLGT